MMQDEHPFTPTGPDRRRSLLTGQEQKFTNEGRTGRAVWVNVSKDAGSKLGIDIELGIWSLTFMAWGGLTLAGLPWWARVPLFLLSWVANALLVREVRELRRAARRPKEVP